MENKYHNAKIYRIVCNETGKTYYGSTCEPTLAKRLAHHISNYKRWKEGKSENYTTSYEIFEKNNYQIFLCESVKCENKDELRMCERKWIEGNECVNKVKRPIRTKNENLTIRREYAAKYQHENRDMVNTKALKHYYDNKETIQAYRSQIIKCECGCELTRNKLSRHKQTQKHADLMASK